MQRTANRCRGAPKQHKAGWIFNKKKPTSPLSPRTPPSPPRAEKKSETSTKWRKMPEIPFLSGPFGHGEVRVYRGTGVSRGVRQTTWERSLKNWELQISCFEEFLGGENVLGLVPASLPHTLRCACTFYAPPLPLPQAIFSIFQAIFPPFSRGQNPFFGHFHPLGPS